MSRDILYCSRFIPINPTSRPAAHDLLGWLVVDFRHDRALFVTSNTGTGAVRDLDFLVWIP